MKISADQVYRTWTGSPALGAASVKDSYVSVFCTSWIQGDTLGKFEMMILLKSQMKPSTNLCSQLNIAPQLSFRYDKWLSLRNEYDLLFEMRICTCVINHSALCKLSFALVNDKLQEAEYDDHKPTKAGAGAVFSKWFMTLFSRAEPFLSDGSQIETARRRGRRAVISRA